MDKRLIFSFVLLSLVGISFLTMVSAKLSGQDDLTNSIPVHKGWNLVAGFEPSKNILPESEIKGSDISAMWYYSPIQKKYVEIHPDLDLEGLDGEDDDYVLTSAMWLYSTKDGVLTYYVPDDISYLEDREMHSGWNFVTFGLDFYDNDFDGVKGTCDISKAYWFDPKDQNWIDLEDGSDLFEEEDLTGTGFILKVSNNCKLGSSGSSLNPPEVPSDESKWNNYVYESDIEELDYVDSDVEGDCDLYNDISEGECKYFGAEYHLGDDDIYLVALQGYIWLSLDDYINYMKSNYRGSIEKGDFGGDFYFVGNNLISWYSDEAIITIIVPENFENAGDNIEDLIGVYMAKYPSELNFEVDG